MTRMDPAPDDPAASLVARYVTWRDHTPDEEAAFDRYARGYCVRSAEVFCAAFLLALPLYYLVDRAALESGVALRDSARWRLGVGAILAAGVVSARVMRITGRDGLAYPLGLAGGIAMCGVIGVTNAGSAPLGSVTTAAFLLLPLCTVPVVARLWFRALSTVLAAAAVLGGFFATVPQRLAHPGAAYFGSVMVFACLLSVAIGHALSQQVRQGYFLAQRLAQSARALDARVQERTGEIRELLAHMVEAREDERARISREVHDELGQVLGGAALSLDRVRSLPEGDERSDEVRRARALVGDAMHAARTVVTELRPRLLDDMDLAAAIEALVRRHEETTGVDCAWTVDLDPSRIPPATATVVYRVLQEALTNSARHARAANVSVLLDADDGGLALEVRDDGAGFAPAEVGGRAFGLRGMRERARSLGGSVTVESGPGAGTRVRLTLPWAEGSAA